MGDEHVGGFKQFAAELEAFGGPPVNAGNEIHAVDADGSADEEP